MVESFGAKLANALVKRGPLCVGIDPHPALLAQWDLPTNVQGLEKFALTVVDAVGTEAVAIKPQSAFFETYGPAGIAVLERVQKHAREQGSLVVLDAKRGDIGSTMAAYAQAYLAESSELAVDAITVSPYLGFDVLTPLSGFIQEEGKGVFILARTSNPDSGLLQNSVTEQGKTIAQSIVDIAADANRGEHPMGSVGVVVGATIKPGEVDLTRLNGPILAPGFGAQGATVRDIRRLFGDSLSHVLPVSARALLQYGPHRGALRDEFRRVQDELLAG